MKKFKLNPLTVFVSSITLSLAAHSSFAQEQEPVQAVAIDEEEVVVTGFRKSIINSIDTKRNEDTIVEAISAEDIGGLPDVSIADSLARLPGVTTERTGGQAGSIQIRGLSGEFVFATLNGREQVSPNRGRTIEFNQYPAELLSQVAVYKTPKASLIEGGVAGTVEMKTSNPLDMTEDHRFNINVRGSYNDRAGDVVEAEEFGNRFSFSYQGKYLDDTLGFSAGYARLDQGNVDMFYSGLGWSSVNDADYVDMTGDGIPNSISDGFEFSHRGGEEIRNGYLLAVQYEPIEQLSIKADVYLSQFESKQSQKGFLWQNLANFEIDNPVLAPNGVDIVGGQATLLASTRENGPDTHNGGINPANEGFQTVASDQTDDDEVKSGGINFKWVEDRWEVAVDFSRSEAEGFHADGIARAHLYDSNIDNATGRFAYDANGNPVLATGEAGEVAFLADPDGDGTEESYLQATDANGDRLYDYARVDGIMVSWLNQAGELPRLSVNQDFTNTDRTAADTFMQLSTYERYPHLNTDEIDAVKMDGKFNFDDFFITSVEAGLRYSERNYRRGRQTFVYSSFDGVGGNNLRSVAIGLDESTTDVVNWKDDDFEHFPAFLNIDAEAVFAQAIADGLVLNNDGTVRDPAPRARWGEGRSWSMFQRADVTEEVLSYYMMANMATEVAGKALSGNFGVRIVDTDQSAVGIRTADPVNGIEASDIRDELGLLPEEAGLAPQAYFEEGDTYTKVLPSLNLTLELTDQDQLRFAASRVIARADIDDLANDAAISANFDPARQSYTIDFSAENNPFIRPFEADQIDLSFEHYFEETDGYVSVAVYYKDILNRQQTVNIDPINWRENNFLGIDIPESITQPEERENGEVINRGGTFDVEDEGSLSVSVNNDDAGFIRGLELSFSQTFNFLPEPFDTLGLQANFSRVDSEITQPNPFTGVAGATVPLPGLAEKSGSFTVYWEYEGFETRLSANYQSEKVGELFDPTGGDGNLTVFEAQTTVAFQTSYMMDNGLNILFQVNNLTDEPNKAYQGDRIKTDQIQYFGRQFFLGANYSFDL